MITIPATVRANLESRYGPEIHSWLSALPGLMDFLSRRWQVQAVRVASGGQMSLTLEVRGPQLGSAILKLVPEGERFRREHAALSQWNCDRVPRIVDTSSVFQALLTTIVTGTVGGYSPPADSSSKVASALSELHARDVTRVPELPNMDLRISTEAIPRIFGSPSLHAFLNHALISDAVDYFQNAIESANLRRTVLHGDLYKSNILFDRRGEAYFVDPRGYVGPPEYDWAFWTLFYDDDGFSDRLGLALKVANNDREVLRGFMLLCLLDTIRYRINHGDQPTAEKLKSMLEHEFFQATLRIEP